jgi:hypothetical protein
VCALVRWAKLSDEPEDEELRLAELAIASTAISAFNELPNELGTGRKSPRPSRGRGTIPSFRYTDAESRLCSDLIRGQSRAVSNSTIASHSDVLVIAFAFGQARLDPRPSDSPHSTLGGVAE